MSSLNWKLIELKQNIDERGKMIVLQQMQQVPFDIKRIFYIFDVDKEAIRGQHANKNSKFLLVCICGELDVVVEDNDNKEVFHLAKDQALYINQMVWKEMYNFSNGCILMCITNTDYDSNEYIRDYSIFKMIN